jgi:hypothetical protein
VAVGAPETQQKEPPLDQAQILLPEAGAGLCFYGASKDEKGTGCRAWLYHAAYTPIRRHVKVRGEANPYDPRREEYFEKREGVKILDNLRGVRQLRYFWREQNGLCLVCGQKITKLTGWHNHHFIY